MKIISLLLRFSNNHWVIWKLKNLKNKKTNKNRKKFMWDRNALHERTQLAFKSSATMVLNTLKISCNILRKPKV